MEDKRKPTAWEDLQFKAKDLILFCSYLTAGVMFITKITSAIERQGDKITDVQAQIIELKNDGKGSTKDTQIFMQSLQNQINATSTQVRLLDQRVTTLENKK
ncbi:hypothetical protein FW774_05840 [Pedobacter sp. BS3]|uniref:hypothetical protein n=1 Tax=Pedobacter sp. BS3 TaxID=2567937 RepID=UPI0011EEB10D|nr:hypothetical protein [Pedobacter sp. BS3]TZF84508.1 hypothetical protein FW774_05840 [Pedobacter sp. BS3]